METGGTDEKHAVNPLDFDEVVVSVEVLVDVVDVGNASVEDEVFVSQNAKDDAVEDVADVNLLFDDVDIVKILEVDVNHDVNDDDDDDDDATDDDGEEEVKAVT